MDTFKFACPVCGQHISCEPDKAGSQMACPTCFQKLVVPQAPVGATPGFIITASKVSERPRPKMSSAARPRVEGKKPPYAAIGFFAVLIGAAVCGYFYKDKIFKSSQAQPAPVTNAAASPSPQSVVAPLPQSAQTNWTLNLTNVFIPDAPVIGRVHAKDFHCERASLNYGNLNLRQGDGWPPDLGASIRFEVGRAEVLAGRSIFIVPTSPRAPEVDLRWKDVLKQSVKETLTNGYAMRLMFGAITNGELPGKIYLCTPDGEQSWVVGRFDAQIHQ